MEQWSADWYPWLFKVKLSSYVLHQDLPFLQEEAIFVLEDAIFLDDLEIGSRGWWRTIDHVLEQYPHKHRHREGGASTSSSKARAVIPEAEVETHPWLQRYVKAFQTQPGQGSSTSRPQRLALATLAVAPLTEEELHSVWQELAEKRSTWGQAASVMDQDFIVEVRGGKWTAQHKNVSVDAISASARSEAGRRWCSTYGANKMASFSTIKYGEAVAGVLAQEWAKRRQHFLDIWVAQGAGSYTYTQADVESYTPSGDWVEFYAGLQPGQPVRERAMAIETFHPRLPASASASSHT